MPNIYIGQKPLKELYIGTSPVKEVYVGTKLAWSPSIKVAINFYDYEYIDSVYLSGFDYHTPGWSSSEWDIIGATFVQTDTDFWGDGYYTLELNTLPAEDFAITVRAKDDCAVNGKSSYTYTADDLVKGVINTYLGLKYYTIYINVGDIVAHGSGQICDIKLTFSDAALRDPMPVYYVNDTAYDTTDPITIASIGDDLKVSAPSGIYFSSIGCGDNDEKAVLKGYTSELEWQTIAFPTFPFDEEKYSKFKLAPEI